jgi:outer membrane lipopolysaccharide assembly protein LptE/RlpB
LELIESLELIKEILLMPFWKKFFSIFCIVLLWGCGYQMVGKETHVPPGLTSVAIPTFVNHTLEPGIEILITQAFLKGFIQDRRTKVVDRNEADSVLEGTIKSFEISSVSYDRSGLALEYQMKMVADLMLKKRSGEILWRERNLEEITWYRASSNALFNEANKAAAVQEAGKSMAERVRNRFFYNF